MDIIYIIFIKKCLQIKKTKNIRATNKVRIGVITQLIWSKTQLISKSRVQTPIHINQIPISSNPHAYSGLNRL